MSKKRKTINIAILNKNSMNNCYRNKTTTKRIVSHLFGWNYTLYICAWFTDISN